jgi:hypothetical protein
VGANHSPLVSPLLWAGVPPSALVSCLPLFTQRRRRSQPVEKVSVELVATTNRAPIAPTAACSVPFGARSGVIAGTKGVFQQPGAFSES